MKDILQSTPCLLIVHVLVIVSFAFLLLRLLNKKSKWCFVIALPLAHIVGSFLMGVYQYFILHVAGDSVSFWYIDRLAMLLFCESPLNAVQGNKYMHISWFVPVVGSIKYLIIGLIVDLVRMKTKHNSN